MSRKPSTLLETCLYYDVIHPPGRRTEEKGKARVLFAKQFSYSNEFFFYLLMLFRYGRGPHGKMERSKKMNLKNSKVACRKDPIIKTKKKEGEEERRWVCLFLPLGSGTSFAPQGRAARRDCFFRQINLIFRRCDLHPGSMLHEIFFSDLRKCLTCTFLLEPLSGG